jgi:pimeloyl-ACP methyl ester carboxylesterase
MAFNARRSIELGKRIWQKHSDDAVSGSAAAVSYYFLFSFFPFLVFVAALIAYLPLKTPVEHFLDRVRPALPAQVMLILDTHLKDLISRERPRLLTLGLLGSFWSASRGVDAARHALNLTYGVKESRPLWKTELLCWATTVAGALLVLVAASALLVGGGVGPWIAGKLGIRVSVGHALAALAGAGTHLHGGHGPRLWRLARRQAAAPSRGARSGAGRRGVGPRHVALRTLRGRVRTLRRHLRLAGWSGDPPDVALSVGLHRSCGRRAERYRRAPVVNRPCGCPQMTSERSSKIAKIIGGPLVAGLAFALACAHEPSNVQPLHSPEGQPLGLKVGAPVNPEVRDLPDVSAWWFKPSGSAARLYLLEVGPHSTKYPPLVLFHGDGPGGNRDFYPILAKLSTERRVIAVDLPGFGRSERAGDDFAPDQMVRQVASVVNALGVRRVDVLGHSSGGPLALLFAAQSPKLVRRLVLLDPVGLLRPETLLRSVLHDQLTGMRKGSRIAAGIVEKGGDALLSFGALLVGSSGGISDSGVAGSTPRTLLALALLDYNFGAALFGMRAPTLLVWGDRDDVAPLRIAHVLEDRIPGSKLAFLKDAGHVPMRDQPAALAELVTSYLDDPIAALAERNAPKKPVQDKRCAHQDDVTITGDYGEINLDHCKNARLDRVRARRIVARESNVHIERGYVTEGVIADGSDLEITGGDFRGEVALDLNGGTHDVAGADIEGKVTAVRARDKTTVLFSVTRIKSPKAARILHEAKDLAKGQEL